MGYALKASGNVAVIEVSGMLDGKLPGVVKQALDHSRYVLLDLGEVTPIGSDAPMLMSAQQLVANKHGVLGVCPESSPIGVMLITVGLDAQIPVFVSQKAGIKRITERTTGKVRSTEMAESGLRPTLESIGDERLHHFVLSIVRSLQHIRIFEQLQANRGMIDLKPLAKALGEKPVTVTPLLQELQGCHLIKQVGKDRWRLDPTPEGQKLLTELMANWKHPKNRKKVMAWLTEAQKMSHEREGDAPQAKEKGGLLGRFFKK